MAINIRFTAQEQEVIKSLRAMGEETSRLVDENIKLAKGFAESEAKAKFFARGVGKAEESLNKLGQSERDFSAAQFKANEVRRKAAERTAAAERKMLDDMGQSERDFSAARFRQAQLREKAAATAQRDADRAVKDAQRRADAEIRAADRVATAIERAAQRKANAEANAAQRIAQTQAREANRKREDIANAVASAVGFQFSGPASGIGGAIGGLQGAAVGASIDGLVALGKEVSQTTEKYNRLQMALDTATGSSKKGAEAFAFIVNIARQTGLRIDDLADSYKGFAAASKGTKLEGKETERIFTSIVKAGAAMMLSNEQVKGSLLAVSQMMSKGNVQAEELRGQLSERLPGAFNILAQEMGVTTAQLNDLLKAGAVLSEEALPKLANGLDKISKDQYAKNLNTVTGAMNNLKNEVDLVMVSFGRESNINGFFASILNGAASVVRSGYLEKIADGFLRMSPIGGAYAIFDAKENYDKTQQKYKPMSGAEAITNASNTSLTEQKSWLDKGYKYKADLDLRIKGLKDLAPYEEKQIANLEREQKAFLQTYSERKKAYDGEIIQRKIVEEERQKRLGFNKEETKELKDINKEIKKKAELLNDLIKKNPNYDKTEKGLSLINNISALNQEKNRIQELAKLGKPPKEGSAESAFERQIRKDNEAGKDLFKERMAIIKAASEEAQMLIQFPQLRLSTEFENAGLKAPVQTPAKVYGKGVADINTGFGVTGEFRREKWDKMLPDVEYMSRALTSRLTSFQQIINEETGKLEWNVVFDPDKIKVPAKGFVTEKFSGVLGELEAIGISTKDTVATFGASVGGAFASLGEALATGENPFAAFGQFIVGSLADTLIQIGTQMLIEAALFAAGIPLTAGLTAPQATRFAIGGALMTTAGGAMKAVKFADGGIVSGPTFSMTGEYAGARNNPEVIAPLNKLGNIFAPYFQKAVSMGRYNQPQLATQAINTQTNVYMDGKVFLQQLDKTIQRKGRI